MEVTIIRKVKLSMNEQKKYEIIKSLADHPAANKQRAWLYRTSYQSYAERLQRTWKGIFYKLAEPSGDKGSGDLVIL